MKVFISTDFDGQWPVGTSAIIVAHDPEEALQLLLQELEARGLPQDKTPGVPSVEEVDLTEVKVDILNDGNY